MDGTIPPTIDGLLPGQSPLTLSSGVALTLKSGRTLTSADATADVALTSQALAKADGWTVGSTLTLNGTKVTLVGLYSSGDNFDDNSIVLPFQTAQKIYGITGATGVTAYADSVSDVTAVASRLRSALGSSLDVVAQSQIYNDIITSLHATQKTIETTLAISVVVAALVIIFAVFLIVRERTQEIGLMRDIGSSRRQIVQQFAVETLTLGEAAAPGPEAVTVSAARAPKVPATVVARGLRKDFMAAGEIVRAVDDVSFEITTRQFVAITGPSGCGKTTLLYLLGSLEQPTAGSLLIDGVDVAGLRGKAADEFRRKSIGFIFQSFYLIPNLTAMENVMLPMEVAGVPRRERGDRAASLLDQVGLTENRYHHRPNKLSGGQQQRVAVARALANDPAVILADEPTGNLDSNNSKRLVSLLRSLAKQGRTIIMVTHDRGIARLADVRMDLVDGRIVRMTTQTQTLVQEAGRNVSEPAAKRRKKRRSGR